MIAYDDSYMTLHGIETTRIGRDTVYSFDGSNGSATLRPLTYVSGWMLVTRDGDCDVPVVRMFYTWREAAQALVSACYVADRDALRAEVGQ